MNPYVKHSKDSLMECFREAQLDLFECIYNSTPQDLAKIYHELVDVHLKLSSIFEVLEGE